MDESKAPNNKDHRSGARRTPCSVFQKGLPERSVTAYAGFFLIPCLLLCLLAPQALADEYLVVAPNNKPYYQQAIKGIDKLLGITDHYTLTTPEQLPHNKKFDAVIALGTASAKKIISQKRYLQQKVIFSLLPKSSIIPLLKQYPSQQYCVLAIDQPLQRQLAITRKWFPQIKNLAVLYSKPYLITDMPAEISAIAAKSAAEQQKQLSALLQGFDALIAIADPEVYSRKNLRNIILTAIKHKKPIIGFSASMVKAGALLSAYTPPVEIGKQSLTLAQKHLPQTGQPCIVPPETFYIRFNQRLADILLLSPATAINPQQAYRDEDLK